MGRPKGSSGANKKPESVKVEFENRRRERERSIVVRLIESGEIDKSILSILDKERDKSDIWHRGFEERERVLAEGEAKLGNKIINGKKYHKYIGDDGKEVYRPVYDSMNRHTRRSEMLVHVPSLEKRAYLVLISNGFGRDRAREVLRFDARTFERSVSEDHVFRKEILSRLACCVDDCDLMFYELAMEGDKDAADKYVRSRRSAMQSSVTQRSENRRLALEERKVNHIIGETKKQINTINYDDYIEEHEVSEYNALFDKVRGGIPLDVDEKLRFADFQCRFLQPPRPKAIESNGTNGQVDSLSESN